VDCLRVFAEDTTKVSEIVAKIESVFVDDANVQGIKLSSIHKAKGLEAHRVFLIEPPGATVPHPMAKTDWQKKQEWNLRYVAITRAIGELVYVK
jgi:superfamily I DNA/RNA helicase